MSLEANGVTVGWGKGTLSVVGRSAISFLLMASGVLLMGWIVNTQLDMHQRVMDDATKSLKSDHRAMIEEMKIQSYLLSLPEAKRPQFAIPPSVYSRLVQPD